MANEEQLAILKQGVAAWNKWRKENLNIEIVLSGVDLRRANLVGSNLKEAELNRANLYTTNLSNANLTDANLRAAKLRKADLSRANLNRTDFMEADLRGANLKNADLGGAILVNANLREANLHGANLSYAILSGADLGEANLSWAELQGADLVSANLGGANLGAANLHFADLSGADLSGAVLQTASLVKTIIDKAKISRSSVYGINVWDLRGEFEGQKDLIITPPGAPIITVDNIEVAQFIYLILNNKKIRNVIETLTSKTVLILGRFTPERKAVLDALKNELRENNLLPIIFDFERSDDKDITETIKTLAGLCYFVIADITNPKSSPLELQATVPDYQIPFVPIIQEGEQPFAMMVDLQKKYNWVLDTLSYNSIETLMKALKPAIIDPAIQKHNELRLLKAREPKIRSAGDFIDGKGI